MKKLINNKNHIVQTFTVRNNFQHEHIIAHIENGEKEIFETWVPSFYWQELLTIVSPYGFDVVIFN